MRESNFCGNVCVTSSAGTGKTTTLIKRLKDMLDSGINPKDILVFTFTVAGADELKKRLGDNANGMTVGTMHSVFYSILRNILTYYGYKLPKVMKDYEVESKISDIAKKYKEIESMSTRDIILEITNKINEIEIPTKSGGILSVFYDFEEYKNKENLCTYDDMLYKTYWYLKNNMDIREKFAYKWGYILVDEFQDSNLLQVELLKILSAKYHNLYVIGDAKQTIYGFRGSNHEYITNFKDYFKDAKIERLSKTYRTPKKVLSLVNSFSTSRLNEEPIETAIDKEGSVNCRAFTSVQDEVNYVARLNEESKDSLILSRTNAGLIFVEFELIKNSKKYSVIGNQYYYDVDHIRNMLNALLLISEPNMKMPTVICEVLKFCFPYMKKLTKDTILANDFSFDELCDFMPDSWADRTSLKKFCHHIKYIMKAQGIDGYNKNVNIQDVLIDIMSTFNYDKYIRSREDKNSLVASKQVICAFLEICDSFNNIDKKSRNNVDELFSFIRKSKQLTHDSKIRLSTIHKAKGLEADNVFIIGVDDGVFPFGEEDTKEYDEEKRLFYVAITRPRDNLTITCHNPSVFFTFASKWLKTNK